MLLAPMDPLPPPPPLSSDSVSLRSENQRFGDLRGLKWRINLGVLPSSTSLDNLRRVTADSRRRYASLRRRLLVEPHIPRSRSADLVMDNPLSQNPDSTWSRFFRSAELERMVDQDLSRLYPEHGSYFQTPGCQGMLRRILLLWCLRHPECGYRQGMHELLAPLLYVLQVDLGRLSEVRKLYDDLITDRFDGLLCQENDLCYSFDFRKSQDSVEDETGYHEKAMKVNSLDELDPEIQTIVLLSDAYGAEGELGIVLSEKFMEHDAYCMFDALMTHGSVATADFFSQSPLAGSLSGLPPVIEASTALYHLLSLVDSSLHSHLLDLGVEPQYFSLRWLRVLFGREFSLDNLLIIWDEIFASDNNSKVEKSANDDIKCGFRILHSPRGAFISAMAVAMLLHLRSSLLATENPTKCLQRLLSFPEDINIEKLLEKAKPLQALALSVDISSSSPLFLGSHHQGKSTFPRSVTLQPESVSPKTPLNLLPDSYWEEKWRVVHNTDENKQDDVQKSIPTRKKGWTEKVKFSLRRTESDPPPSRIQGGKRLPKASVRRSLVEDLRKALGSEEDTEQTNSHEILCQQDNLSKAVEVERQDGNRKGDNNCSSDDRCPSGSAGSEDDLSDQTSPPNETNDHEITSVKSSVASNSSVDESNESSQTSLNDQCVLISVPPVNIPETQGSKDNNEANPAIDPKERKQNKFQWLFKFRRNTVELISEKIGGASDAAKSANSHSNQSSTPSPASSTTNTHGSSVTCKGDTVDQNMMGTLKNIGQSMLDHIQVIESVFQQDRSQGTSVENLSKNVLVGKGQVTAMSALKELRKISNILSEM
ncbi:hypothetical protein TanjilG_11893 [Lupinus angustifolius]|uniref:Rab-GAP TBC domain-containing protein n=1 Tax=Lupinus angustifolius TaxID=3871 RepID=A0A1J7H4C6_LUPAN|nr:PREDICTED: TBC1 domain family member 5 homolog A-like [Lupinus angustifolius]OIW07735.1 hypothetical protein TanjilG_11893 [Lupinus angustifolius]